MTAERSDDQRIVVTGMGCVSPLGLNVAESWDGIIAGRSGIQRIDHAPLQDYPQLKVSVGAIVEGFDLRSKPLFAEAISKKHLGARVHPFVQYALSAGLEALQQAEILGAESIKIDGETFDTDRIGISMGTGIGGANELGTTRKKLDNGERTTIGQTILRVLPERGASVTSMIFGIHGGIGCISAACATGNKNIIAGATAIRAGDADIMIVGGSEAQITPEGFAVFDAISALDPSEDPAEASRPFNSTEKGFVMGEGAGVLVLESLAFARNRGAQILAELVGYGDKADASHDTLPSGKGALTALYQATRRVRLHERVYVNAHATGTGGDKTEMEAISEIFDREWTAISSTKSQTGHTLGAAGAIEAIFAIKALETGIVPATLKCNDPVEATKGWDLIVDEAQVRNPETVVNSSFGFGGINTVTAFSRV